MSSIAERLAAAGTGNAIELRGVSRNFGALSALTDITLNVRPGETLRLAVPPERIHLFDASNGLALR